MQSNSKSNLLLGLSSNNEKIACDQSINQPPSHCCCSILPSVSDTLGEDLLEVKRLHRSHFNLNNILSNKRETTFDPNQQTYPLHTPKKLN